ncbi:hypothetical protein [Methylobacter sp. YRD-M1]|uniref:hypothetical protein n=1 Tax=Methylobacter sp. YRD-M1 TaxID=2911520 RepID=UPI00227C237A|nr:hypothetical protein [Methylobacter sp. YRD-M1]WAK03283.1 hypothetical protein LZ558_05725 [Methylobacter sp. YRD-M1]
MSGARQITEKPLAEGEQLGKGEHIGSPLHNLLIAPANWEIIYGQILNGGYWLVLLATGLIIASTGTSLTELAASVIAALKNARDWVGDYRCKTGDYQQ